MPSRSRWRSSRGLEPDLLDRAARWFRLRCQPRAAKSRLHRQHRQRFLVHSDVRDRRPPGDRAGRRQRIPARRYVQGRDDLLRIHRRDARKGATRFGSVSCDPAAEAVTRNAGQREGQRMKRRDMVFALVALGAGAGPLGSGGRAGGSHQVPDTVDIRKPRIGRGRRTDGLRL